MSDYFRTTCDDIRVANVELAEQLVTEYLTTGELSLALRDDRILYGGEWIFAVQHESNTDDESNVMGEPIDNMHFLADLSRIAADDSIPFTLTEVCEGTLDRHPGLTRYEVTRETITMTYEHGTKEWSVEDFGILTHDSSE